MKKILLLIMILSLFSLPVYSQTLITTTAHVVNSQIYKEIVRDKYDNLWAVILTSNYPSNTSIYKSSDNGTTWNYEDSFDWNCASSGIYHNYIYIINDTIYVNAGYGGTSYIAGYNIKTKEKYNCLGYWTTSGTIDSDGNNLYIVGRDLNLNNIIVTEIPFNLSSYTSYVSDYVISPTYSYPYSFGKFKNNNILSIISTANEEASESTYSEFYLNNKTFSDPISIKNQIGHGFVMAWNSFIITDNESIYLIGKRNSFDTNDSQNILIYSLNNGITWNAYYFNSTFNSKYPNSIGKYYNDVYVLLSENANSLYLYHFNNNTYTLLSDTGTFIGGQIRGGHTKQTTYNYFDRTEAVNRLDILFNTYSDSGIHYGTFYISYLNNFIPESPINNEKKIPSSSSFYINLLFIIFGFLILIVSINYLKELTNKEEIIELLIIIIISILMLLTLSTLN